MADRQPTNLSRIRFLPEVVNLLDSDAIERVRCTLNTLPEPPKLIVIDTMARTMVGGEENSARDIGRLVQPVDGLKVTARLLVHHTGKDGGQERGSHSAAQPT